MCPEVVKPDVIIFSAKVHSVTVGIFWKTSLFVLKCRSDIQIIDILIFCNLNDQFIVTIDLFVGDILARIIKLLRYRQDGLQENLAVRMLLLDALNKLGINLGKVFFGKPSNSVCSEHNVNLLDLPVPVLPERWCFLLLCGSDHH